MSNAEKIVHPDANRPDKFSSNKPWKTRVFYFASYGAIVGTIIFGIIGFFLTKRSVETPLSVQSRESGWPLVFSLGFTGLIVMAVIGGLIALYTRDLKSKKGTGGTGA